jgi:hypothetical protein
MLKIIVIKEQCVITPENITTKEYYIDSIMTGTHIIKSSLI